VVGKIVHPFIPVSVVSYRSPAGVSPPVSINHEEERWTSDGNAVISVVHADVSRTAAELNDKWTSLVLIPAACSVVPDVVSLPLAQFRRQVYGRDESVKESITLILLAGSPTPVRRYRSLEGVRLEVFRASLRS
jgi:hypothetical protein